MPRLIIKSVAQKKADNIATRVTVYIGYEEDSLACTGVLTVRNELIPEFRRALRRPFKSQTMPLLIWEEE